MQMGEDDVGRGAGRCLLLALQPGSFHPSAVGALDIKTIRVADMDGVLGGRAKGSQRCGIDFAS